MLEGERPGGREGEGGHTTLGMVCCCFHVLDRTQQCLCVSYIAHSVYTNFIGLLQKEEGGTVYVYFR